jgi:hypothetical protein
MDLSKIIAITGKPGLYEVVSQIKNGVVVVSLEDGKRFPAYASNQISALKDISMYSYDGEVPLSEVFIEVLKSEGGKIALDSKASNEELKAFFSKVMPNHDAERVYPSDIKKLVKWYNLLFEKGYIQMPAETSDEVVSDAEIIEETKNEE